MKRSEGERVRLTHSISRLRSVVDGLELALKMNGPIGLEATGALMTSSCEVILQIAKLDAYSLAEHDAKEEAAGRCPDCHWPIASGHGSPEGVECPRARKK